MNALPTAIPSPGQGVWYLGIVPIRAYALAILAGIAIAAWIGIRRYRARGGDADTILDVTFWAVPFGIVGGRLYHVISSPERYFGPHGNPWLAFEIWMGGLGIWGAIALGAVGAYIGARQRRAYFAPIADALAPGILVAQAIGRLGNYFNQELFGGPTTLPWGLKVSDSVALAAGYPAGTLFHPTFLYEMVWNLAGAALLVWADRRFKLGHGRVFWLYVAIYTAGRSWIEMLRVDEAEHFFGIRLNVFTSVIVFVLAVVMFIVIGRRHPGRETDVYRPGGPQPVAGSADEDPDHASGVAPALTRGEKGATDDDDGAEDPPSARDDSPDKEPAPRGDRGADANPIG